MNEIRLPDTVLAGGSPAAAGTGRAATVTRLIECTCNSGHDQPTGVHGGCGRSWPARLTLQPGGAYTLSVESGTGMLPAAAALRAAVAGQDESVRTSAEKWTGAVSALYGLFALTGIVTAKDALVGIRAELKTLVALALAVAVITAATALICGYRAAYGWPVPVDVSDDHKLEEWYESRRRYAVTASAQVRKAIVLALVSLMALITMAMLAWFLPRSP